MKHIRPLTIKQEATIGEVMKDLKEGKKLDVASAVGRIYNVNGPESAVAIANKNLKNDNFREALLIALENRDILGPGGKIENRLAEGLDAEDKHGVDYKTRLEYIKEINKIAGVYAPDKKETKSLRLNLNLTPEEVAERISSLSEELEDV